MILTRRFLVACVLVAIYLSICFFAVDVNAQFCYQPDCGDVSFVIEELPDDMAVGCSVPDESCYGTTKEFAVYIQLDNVTRSFPFFLSYKDIQLYLTLEGDPNNRTDFTQFNTGEILSCHSNAKSLGALTADDDLVLLYLDGNTFPCYYADDALEFTQSRLYLFTLVVNTYPGESFTIGTEVSSYVNISGDGVGNCPVDPATCLDPSAPLAVSSIPCTMVQFTEDFLPNPVLNNDLTLKLVKNSLTNNIIVQIENEGGSTITVEDLDFSLLFTTTNNMNPPLIVNDFSHNWIHETPLSTDQNQFQLVNSGITVPAGNTISILEIEYNDPINKSLLTNITAQIIGLANVGTNLECSMMNASSDIIECSMGMGDPCATGAPFFTVNGKQNISDCESIVVEIAFFPPSGVQFPYTLSIEEFNLELDFAVSDIIELNSTNFFAWSSQLQKSTNNSVTGQSSITVIKPSGIPPIQITFTNSGPKTATLTFRTNPTNPSQIYGCVSGFTTRQSWIKYSAGDGCVHDVTTLNSNSFPVCVRELKVDVTTNILADNFVEDFFVDGVDIFYTTSTCQEVGVTACETLAKCLETCLQNNTTDVLVRPDPGSRKDWTNGVNTYDLLLIQKHLLGVAPLIDPYKIIAADINKSQSVTATDIVELRKLILGIYQNGLPANTSWRFVDKNYVFPNPANPFANSIPESILVNLNNPNNPIGNAHFQGIKTGDIDGNVQVCTQSLPKMDLNKASLSASVIPLADQIELVEFRYEGAFDIEALQTELTFDASLYELVQVEKGIISGVQEQSFNLENAEQGRIGFAWFNAEEMRMEGEQIKDKVLFSLVLKRRNSAKSVSFSFGLSKKEASLESLAWTTAGEMIRIEPTMQNQERNSVEENNLHIQAFPNPTNGSVSLTLDLEEASFVKCFLFSAFGRTEYFQKFEFSAGQHQIVLDKMQSLPSGVYTYVLATEKGIQKGKVIKQ